MKIATVTKTIVLSLMIGLPTFIGAQGANDLNQKISISAKNVTISELLQKIGEKTDIKFAYNPKLINANKRVTVISKKQMVRALLDNVFSNKFQYRLRGKYVIIVEKNIDKTSVDEEYTFISGYVIDQETKDGIANVSLYTSAGKSSITDEIGAFKIKLHKTENSNIELRKSDYFPLSFETNHNNSTQVEILLQAEKSISVSLERDSMLTTKLPKTNTRVKTMFPVKRALKLNQENIQDALYKPFSFSLYPGLATYGNLSGNIIYSTALNFVGYNRGINGLEIAVFSNINKDNVTGVQLAGLSNYVGEDVIGVQSAGIFNKVGGNLNGVQVAGVTNINLKDIDGVQVAGVNNVTLGSIEGSQVAGVYNQVDTILGTQVAGVLNLGNYTSGVQVAGVGNQSWSAEGTQISGVYNLVKNVEGGQISGVINIAKNVKGYQIGLINVADSVSGISIGLINWVRSGYKRIEINNNELFPVNISFKSGVNSFYSTLNAGMQVDVFDNESSFYSFGAGIGTSLPLSNRINIDFEVTANHITKQNFTEKLSLNLKGYLGLEVSITKKIALAGGATYNAYHFDRELLDDFDFDSIRDNYILDTSTKLENNLLWRSWIGYKFGFRIVI